LKAAASAGCFTRPERTPDRSQSGLGLGLALVKNLVELHGGLVSCFSEGLDKGSCFSVVLPCMTELENGDRQGRMQRVDAAAAKRLRILIVMNWRDDYAVIPKRIT